MSDCIFCKIIKEEIPSYTIYEDSIMKVFLDVNPNSDGHLLVIPKKHYENLLTIPSDLVKLMVDTVKENIYPVLLEKLNIDGLTICQNNLYGQEVKHFHIHLIPRYVDDDFRTTFNENKLSDIKDIFEKIKK